MAEQEVKPWGEYRRLILSELERISRDLEALNTKLDEFHRSEISQMKVELALLKQTAGRMGAIAGALGGSILSFIVMLVGALILGG